MQTKDKPSYSILNENMGNIYENQKVFSYIESNISEECLSLSAKNQLEQYFSAKYDNLKKIYITYLSENKIHCNIDLGDISVIYEIDIFNKVENEKNDLLPNVTVDEYSGRILIEEILQVPKSTENNLQAFIQNESNAYSATLQDGVQFLIQKSFKYTTNFIFDILLKKTLDQNISSILRDCSDILISDKLVTIIVKHSILLGIFPGHSVALLHLAHTLLKYQNLDKYTPQIVEVIKDSMSVFVSKKLIYFVNKASFAQNYAKLSSNKKSISIEYDIEMQSMEKNYCSKNTSLSTLLDQKLKLNNKDIDESEPRLNNKDTDESEYNLNIDIQSSETSTLLYQLQPNFNEIKNEVKEDFSDELIEFSGINTIK